MASLWTVGTIAGDLSNPSDGEITSYGLCSRDVARPHRLPDGERTQYEPYEGDCEMDRVPPFDPQQTESLAKILGDTDEGLTGTEIGHLLRQCKMDDPTSTMTKWKRLYNAFAEAQNKHGLGNHVIMFINRAMNPVNYTSAPQLFAKRRDQLTTVLSFAGMYVREDGKVGRSERATNLDDLTDGEL